MKDGIIQQVDTPQALYEKPCNKFVAGFLGSPQMNFVESVLRKNGSKYVVEFGSADTKSTRGVIYSVELPEDVYKRQKYTPMLYKNIILLKLFYYFDLYLKFSVICK